MKSTIVFIMSILIFSGCSIIGQQIVEGNTSEQIEACKLVKELSLEKKSISDFSDIKCIFLEQQTTDKSLLLDLELTKSHPDYNNYIEQKNYWESSKEKPFRWSPVLVNLDKKMLLDLNSKKIVIKDGNTFRDFNQEDKIKLLEEKIEK